MNRSVAIAAVALVLVLGLGWWFMRAPAETPVAAEVPAPVVAAPAEEPPAPEPLPALVDSDDLARELARGFGALGEPADGVLAQEGLVRRFVRVVDAVASGGSPASDLGTLAPEEPFNVVETGEQVFVDPSSYDRYDDVAAGIARVDADEAVAAYRLIEPLADEVYSEMVGDSQAFRPVLMRALSALLAVPMPQDPPELVDAINRYRYADTALESLSLSQKHLLRMGPANIGRVQARLRQIARLLG